MERYKCRMCGKRFDDLFTHLQQNINHLGAYKEIKNSFSGKYGKKQKCFCGGEIVAVERVKWIDDGWSYFVKISCNKCGFLWDE